MRPAGMRIGLCAGLWLGGCWGSAGGSDAVDAGSDGGHQPSGVCGVLVQCDLIPGAPLTVSRCLQEIDDICATCAHPDTEDDQEVVCDDVLKDVGCAQRCNLLIEPPADVEECQDVVLAQPNTTGSYATCLCEQCFAEHAACVADDGCWLVMQCAYDAACTGMACYSPEACMAIIDHVGATSVSVVLATELGNCSATFCEAGIE